MQPFAISGGFDPAVSLGQFGCKIASVAAVYAQMADIDADGAGRSVLRQTAPELRFLAPGNRLQCICQGNIQRIIIGLNVLEAAAVLIVIVNLPLGLDVSRNERGVKNLCTVNDGSDGL